MPLKVDEVFRDVDGVFVSRNFCEHTIRSALSYEAQPGDVFIVSYPKCGTTWTEHIVYNILTSAVNSEDMLDFMLRMPFLERQGADAAVHSRKPGAIKTHLTFDKISYSSSAKYIYVARNPYDACVSFYYFTKHFPGYGFQDGTFDEYFREYVRGRVDFGDYFDHLLSWYEHRSDDNVLFLTYEGLKRETRFWVIRLAEFLGDDYGSKLRREPRLLNLILEKCSVDGMRKTINAFRRMPWEDIASSFNQKDIDPHLSKALQALSTFLEKPMTGDFIRKGIVGDWKNHLSLEQITLMKQRIEYKTQGSDVMRLWDGEDIP